MTIEPFGELKFYERDKEWFGRVKNICPDYKVELSISAESENQNIEDKIELVRQLALDYNTIISDLQQLVFQSYNKTKTLDDIKQMYFLTAVSLKSDNKTWWLTLEPHFNIPRGYDHFQRFTMINRKIVWANFDINTNA